MATIQRVHGSVAAGAFYGYQPLFLKITGTNVATADTLVNGNITVTGNFSKAITAIQQVGSIVYIGPRADGGFIVALDGATATDNNESDVATRVDTVVTAATSVTTTVVVPGMLAANVS
jgi:hypothetical protein